MHRLMYDEAEIAGLEAQVEELQNKPVTKP
jgi:hypothetical protein